MSSEKQKPVSWKKWYWFVLLFLALQILIYTWLTHHYS